MRSLNRLFTPYRLLITSGAALFYALYGCFAINRNSIELTFISIMGGVVISDELPHFLSVALHSSIMLIFLMMFGSLIPEEVDRVAVFVFSRTHSRYKWILNRLLHIGIITFLYFILLSFCLITFLLLLGTPLTQPYMLFKIFLILLPSTAMCMMSFIIFANVMGLLIKTHYAVLLTWIIFIPGQILAGVKYTQRVITFYPSAQALLPLHEIPALTEEYNDYFSPAVTSFTISFSFIYNCIFIIALGIIAIFVIRRKDFTI